jgi:hypothetical protein
MAGDIRASFDELHAAIVALRSESIPASERWDRLCAIAPAQAAFFAARMRANAHAQWRALVCAACEEGMDLLPGLVSDAASRPDDLGAPEWLLVYRLISRLGLFDLALPLREHAKAQAKLNTTAEPQAAAAALAEHGDFAAARALSARLPDQKMRTTFELLFDALGTGAAAERAFKADDAAFRETIGGRRVAIVGPARQPEPPAEVLAAYDVVVRCNLRDARRIEPGQRADITYLNNWIADFSAGEVDHWPASLTWAVFKTQKEMENFRAQFAARTPASVPRTRRQRSLNADLLRFSPAQIAVFNVDLMLTTERALGYHRGEFDDASGAGAEFLRQAVLHDPATQFVMLSTWWRNGRIIGDDRFAAVMDLGLHGYMSRLRAIYGPAPSREDASA